VIGVSKAWIFALVDGIEELKDVLPNEFIIAIDLESDCVVPAVIVDSEVDVGKRSMPSILLNDNCPLM
jgi:hypothetical protein